MFKDENRHYSLRKLSVGLASVLIGISFVNMTGNSVKADTVESGSNSAQTVVKGSNAAVKIGAKDDTNAIESNTESADEASKKDPNAIAQGTKQKATKDNALEAITKNVTDGSQITAKKTLKGSDSLAVNNDAVKDTVEVAKQGLETPAVKHADDKETTLNVNGSKAEVKENQALADPATSKLKMATLMTTTGKKFNAQMLSASKVMTPAKDTNGGFDEATWGTLDINAWKGSVQGDYYQLTSYIGDYSHVIVPNEADFEKAGISTSGKQVGVTSDLMKSIRNITSYNDGIIFGTNGEQTVAFSKTDNKQIKALNSDWSNTWSNDYQNTMSPITQFDGSSLDVSSVTNMRNMFKNVANMDLSSLSNWNVSNVTDMSDMFNDDYVHDLSPLANWDVSKVTDMNSMFSFNGISDLSPLAKWDVSNVTDMGTMFSYCQQISDLSPLTNWKVDKVTDMNQMFAQSQISDLSPLTNWKTDNVTNMSGMFQQNQISDLSPLAKWQVGNVGDMSHMFESNQIGDLSPLANWKVNNVTDMHGMFDDNSGSKTKTATAKRIIDFVYPAGYTGKKQDSVTQTVDVPQKVSVTLTTKESKPSNNILDWINTAETEVPEDTATVYFPDYTVPEIKGLLEPDKLSIAGQQIAIANPDKAVISGLPANTVVPINVTVIYKLVESNINDAYALDPKNGLHEHANVNDNGGYDENYWGKLNINDWNYTTNDNTITITGYKGNNHSSLIIPNGADFDLANGQGAEQSNVEISSSVMHDLAKNATRIGLSKTANKKVIAKDAIWHDAFGGLTNKPGTDSNAYGGIKYGSPNLTQMDLHNLDTAAITDMSALFNGGSNLTTVGDLSDWNTSNVTTMRTMFQKASNLTNIGNLDNWDTRRVTDMASMFGNATNLTNIGDLSKWQTGNVTNMQSMFSNATSLTNIGNLDNWDTNKVTDMSWMFGTDTGKQSHLTNIGDLSKWQTGNVTDMNDMFANATSLTNIGNLDNWDTNKVTDMSWMFGTNFGKQSHLTNIGNLSKWQTNNVTNMHNMFYNATSLTNIGDLSKWNTSKATNMRGMFYNATSLTNIGNLDNWDTSKVTDMSCMFDNTTSLTNIGDLSKWQTGNVTDMAYMFANATSLTNIGNLDNWDTNKVTDMSWMFGTDTGKQSHLTNIGDLSKWQTGNVTDMAYMFVNATSLTNIGNLDNWDTNKVTDMAYMFANTTSLTNIGDLSKWQTGNVTDMHWMFTNATSLTNIGNLDNWDTNKVTDMHWMFGADYDKQSHLTNIGDLSKWDTSHVTDMNNMFANKALLHLNISNWNLTNLANKDAMKCMFANVTNLTVIANNLKLPTWYENEINNADYFWNNHIAVITNVPELIKATGDINNLKIDDQDASRSIFYDSKGSSDAIKVLTDANNQYIADYHKANPTKFLKLADTVDQNDPIALANANFITVPAAVGLTVHFEDVDPNANKDSDTVKQELAKTVELSGHSGDTADLSQVQLPTNFELSGDLPSATFGKTDSVTIQLKHKLSDEITSKENGVAAARTEVIAPDDTVLIQGGAGVQSFIDRRQDLVTGEMVDVATHWTYGTSSNINVSSDILNKYIEQYNPAILDTSMNKSTRGWQDTLSGLRQPLQIKLKDGYTVKSIDDWEDWNNNGTYTWVGLRGSSDWNIMKRFNGYDAFQIAPLDQSIHYQFVDDGVQVGSDVIITGKTGETVAPNLPIPENYEVADGTTLPTSYTFAATNPTIQINLKHKTETSVESLPATRTINVHLPNGTTKVYQQIIGYQRDVITDLVTKTVTRGTWTVNDVTSSFTIDGVKQLEHSYVLRNGNYNFAGIKLPKVPGYKAKVSKNNGLLLVSYLALAPAKPEINTNLNDQFSNNLAVNSTIKSDLIVKSDMYQVVNDDHNWQLPVIKNYELKFATNKNQIIFAYTKDKQNDYRFVLTFKDGQYRLATFDKENKLLKTYSIKSYDELTKIIHSLVLMNIA